MEREGGVCNTPRIENEIKVKGIKESMKKLYDKNYIRYDIQEYITKTMKINIMKRKNMKNMNLYVQRKE